MTGGALQQEISAALGWWQLAGVDADYAEAPRGWLRGAAPVAEAPAPAPAPAAFAPVAMPAPGVAPAQMLGGVAAGWPTDLAAFRQWWLAEPSLDGGRVAGRVASRGDAGAALLVLVPQPEVEDEGAGQLLAGPHGRLVAAMARAMGLAEGDLAVAALLPRHTPFADWDSLGAAGLGALARHHISLIAPLRLLVLGASILPLLGHDPAQSPALAAPLGPEGAPLPLLAAPEVEALFSRPAARARAWRDWLDWTS